MALGVLTFDIEKSISNSFSCFVFGLGNVSRWFDAFEPNPWEMNHILQTGGSSREWWALVSGYRNFARDWMFIDQLGLCSLREKYEVKNYPVIPFKD